MIYANENGVHHELTTVAVNENNVTYELEAVYSTEGNISYEIYSAVPVVFSVESAGWLDGYSISFEYDKTQAKVIFAGQASDGFCGGVIRIWIKPIRAGDTVKMQCSFTRDTTGYYISSTHHHADGTTAATNGYQANGLYVTKAPGGKTYTVEYTATTNQGYIDLNINYDTAITNLTFTIDDLYINGKQIF